MGIIKFIFSKTFLFNLLLAIVVIVISYFITDNFLTDYTQKGKTITVPNVLNEQVEDLPELLEKNGFRYEVLDSTWERKKKKGIVLEQNPEAGMSVKEGRKIYVKINARTNKKIKLHLDNVIGGGKRQAEEVIASMDVKIDSVLYKDGQYPNIVLAVKDKQGRNLKNGDLVFAGSKLILVVSKTGDESVEVPNLVGMNLSDAEHAVFAANLNSSNSSLQSNCKEVPTKTTPIESQRPVAGTSVKTGTSVSLFYHCDSIR